METDYSFIALLGAITLFLIDWIIRITLLFYVPKNRKPTAAMAWLLAIFIIPGLGIFLFLIIGSTKLSRRRRAQQRLIDNLIAKVAHPDNALKTLPLIKQERYRPLIDLAHSLGKLPARTGNTFALLGNYDEALADIARRIDEAKDYVYLEYYIIALDSATEPIFKALEAAVARGVDVHVMFDTYGSRKYKNYKLMKQELTRMGVRWRAMLPLRFRPSHYNRPDLRNHRKIVVIDAKYAYIGSQNLIERRYERKDSIYYDEFVTRMSGPVVNQCAAIFAGDWFSETGERLRDFTHLQQPHATATEAGGALAQILPSGPAYTYENNLKLFVSLMYAARKRIVITNPYFVPDESLLTAVISAAQRGVEVILINSEAMDQWMVGHAQRSYYAQLLAAGVKIYLYRAPVLLHSKHLTIDDDIAVIGSSNMDIRSFELVQECVVICYDQRVVKKLQKQQQHDLAASRQIHRKEWRKRSVLSELLDNIARLTAALQ